MGPLLWEGTHPDQLTARGRFFAINCCFSSRGSLSHQRRSWDPLVGRGRSLSTSLREAGLRHHPLAQTAVQAEPTPPRLGSRYRSPLDCASNSSEVP